MRSSAQERSVAPASVPVESPLPADRRDRRSRRQAPAWAVAIAATCAVLACGGAVAAFALLGGLSATGEEPEGQVRVVAEQPGAPEPAPVEEVAAEDEPAAEPEPAPEPDPASEATTSPEPAAATEAAAQDEAFWGVWIGAFSERQNAQERADLASGLGFSDVRIEFSGDWAELNQAGYYVVSVGTYSSQTQAEGALSSAQRHFSDAYVKYSGAHK